uniref:mannan-binding lectin serine protease 2-like n=1 Tax=Styela clava TaxID=7725 RepID=UPI00193AA0B2|nr:mannan-binding lectin serine protease 2-like [Styela clava]
MIPHSNQIVSTILLLLISTTPLFSRPVEHHLNEISGKIKSPSYPKSYPENVNISWYIEVKPGYRVELYFTEFDLEDSYDEDQGGACVYDFLKVMDGEKLMNKYCGNSRMNSIDAPRTSQKVRSTSNTMSLHFISDYSNEEPMPKGFFAHYTEIDRDECWELKMKAETAIEDWDTMLYCNQHCHNVPASYYCSCNPGFKLHENKHTCTNDCARKVLTGDEGEITTSRFPDEYSKLANCDWTIKKKEGIAIELQFVEKFDIEVHDDEGCVYDWVQYEDAYGVRSDKFCGTKLPNNGNWIITNSHLVKVIFVSDLTMEESGFKLKYRTTRVACFNNPKAPENGKITSIKKKENYEFEDVVTFKCDIGYRLIGKKKIECLSNGKWSDPEPKCQIKRCKHPVHLNNIKDGRIKEKVISLTYGSKVTVLCYQWYEMTSGTSVWRCGDDEKWHEYSRPVAINEKNNVPECQPICGLKGNEKIRKGTFDFGDVIPNIEDKEKLLDSQIIAGKKARLAEWPWVVYINLFGDNLEGHEFCGGNLVSHDVVITAAHCTARTYKRQIRVFAGVTNREKKKNKFENVQVFSVKDVFEHPNYSNTSQYENDIAILKLNASVKIGKYVRPICLPRSDREASLPVKALTEEDGYQKTGIIAGWGITELGYSSYKLMEARVPPIDHRKCKKHVSYDGDERLKVSDNMICAGFLDGQKDSCQGDSGGPYMFRDQAQHRWILSGIVSFGSSARDCGDKTFGIYTRVASYMSWIEPLIVS